MIVPPAQPVAVTVVVALAQMLVAPLNTGGCGAAPFVTVTLAEFGDLPHMFSQYAEYVPSPTVIVVPVCVVPFHLSIPTVQAVAVIVTVWFPHITPPPVIVGAVGVGTLVIVIASDAVETPHEVEHVAVTVRVVDTVIVGVVAPVDHTIFPPAQPVAVKVAT